MPLTWYLVVSALIFAIGAGGVLVRRNPLVILLCIELMLNAANLALVGFSRVHGNMDGQMFALIVMVVAACEVAVGLGLIVALFRRRLPIDVDELQRAAGMSLETYGWLVLAFPLAGAVLIALTSKLGLGRVYGVDRHAGDLALLPGRRRRLHRAAVARRGGAAGRGRRLGLRGDQRGRRAGLDPARPAERPDDADRLGRLGADPPLLGGLHGRRPRLRALLRLPELLRLQHAAAGRGGQLPAADHRLGVRRRRLVLPDLVLVPAQDRDRRRHQGVRHQRARRRRARARHLLHLHAAPARSTSCRRSRRSPEAFAENDADLVAGCLLLLRRRVRQVGPGAAPHLAPGRHGGPDAGLRPDPRGDDGDRRRLPDRAHAPAVRAGADRRRRGRGHRLPDAADRRHDRPRRDRPQARHRVLDDVADRLHGHGRELGRLRRRHVPPDDARLLQGAALHGRRLGDRGDGRRPEPRPHVGLPARDAVHLRLHDRRRPRALRHPAVLGLLLQGRDPRAAVRARRLARRARRARLRRRVPDRDLHVPDDLPRVPRRAVRGGQGARARAPVPRRAPDQPDDG